MKRSASRIFALAVVILANMLILGYFYDKNWGSYDDGCYAHIAERLVKGEALNAQVQSIHTGAVNFVNALEFILFGMNLLSLRSFLLLATLLQSCIVFFFFRADRFLYGIAASLALTSLTFIQFASVSVNWYCLFFAVLLIAYLKWLPVTLKFYYEWIGVLLGIIYSFRQTTAVFIAMAVVAYIPFHLRLDNSGIAKNKWCRMQSVILITFAALSYYLLTSSADFIGLVLAGIWPLAILIRSYAVADRVDNDKVVSVLVRIVCGGALVLLPFVFYHVWHGSLRFWIDDTLFRPLITDRSWHGDVSRYLFYLISAAQSLIHPSSMVEFLNGIYWLMLITVLPLNGIFSLTRVLYNRQTEPSSLALPIFSTFLALLALHQQNSVYLYFSVGLCLVSLFWMMSERSRFISGASLLFVLYLATIALGFHAAQPFQVRGYDGAIKGERVQMSGNRGVGRLHLKIDPGEETVYRALVEQIERMTRPGDAIFVHPNNPEIYFLANRKNSFRFLITMFGVSNESEFHSVIESLKKNPPKLIVYNPRSVYTNAFVDRITNYLKNNFVLAGKVSYFEIYVGSIQTPESKFL